MRKIGRVDPVKKWMDRYHKPRTHDDLTKYNRKKGLFKEWMDEDAPVNATGAPVSTDKPIVKKKKKKKCKDNDWSLDAGNNEIGTPDIVKRFKDGTPMESKKSDVKKVLSKVKGITTQQAQLIQTLPMPVLSSLLSALSLVMGEERDYKKEYDNYHSRPEQKKRRAGRNKARSLMKNSKGIKGKDVHHKDNNPENNDKKNLSIVTQHYNRREPRLRESEMQEAPLVVAAHTTDEILLDKFKSILRKSTFAKKQSLAKGFGIKLSKRGTKFQIEDFDEGQFNKRVGSLKSVIYDIEDGMSAANLAKKYQLPVKVAKVWIDSHKKAA